MATLKRKTRPLALRGALVLARLVKRFPASRLWLDYDEEADVLYISLRRPQKATDTVETDDGMLLRYYGKKLVGITVLEASTR